MAVQVGRSIRVSDVIAQAQEQGCALRESELKLVAADGDLLTVRFLWNPKTNGRFAITGYDDDDFMVESEIEAAERRLSIKLV